MKNIQTIVKKTLELCQEKLKNDTLLIEGTEQLCKSNDFLKAKLPIKRFYDISKTPIWELQHPPTTPGVYVFEGMEKLNPAIANSLYGWALHGKSIGVKVIFVSERFPQPVLNNAEKITL